MRAIDFVARRGMGVVERGTVAADAVETVVGLGIAIKAIFATKFLCH